MVFFAPTHKVWKGASGCRFHMMGINSSKTILKKVEEQKHERVITNWAWWHVMEAYEHGHKHTCIWLCRVGFIWKIDSNAHNETVQAS